MIKMDGPLDGGCGMQDDLCVVAGEVHHDGTEVLVGDEEVLGRRGFESEASEGSFAEDCFAVGVGVEMVPGIADHGALNRPAVFAMNGDGQVRGSWPVWAAFGSWKQVVATWQVDGWPVATWGPVQAADADEDERRSDCEAERAVDPDGARHGPSPVSSQSFVAGERCLDGVLRGQEP